MKNNPITTIIGLLVALCPIVGAIFPEAKVICEQLIGELIGLGFIASADGVHVKAPALKSVGMAFLLSVAVIGATACAQMKGITQALNPFVGAIESTVAELAEGEYTVAVTKDGKVLYEETIICTKNAEELTGCHKK